MATLTIGLGSQIGPANSNGDYFILSSGDAGVVSTLSLQLVDGGAFGTNSGAIQIVGRNYMGVLTANNNGQTAPPFVPIPFLQQYINGSVGNESYVSTTLTTNTMTLVPMSGLQIALLLSTAPSAGATAVMTVWFNRIVGSGA